MPDLTALIPAYADDRLFCREAWARPQPRPRPCSVITALGITSLDAERCSPVVIASSMRGHCGIENKLHWVRNVTYGDDASRLCTPNAPQMASTCNLATGAIGAHGWTSIASGTR